MHPFRAAVEAGDHAAMVDLLAEDITFFSPVAHKPFEGRAAASEVLAAVLRTLTEFTYTDELTGDGTHALIFRARVGGRDVEGLDHIVEDADGKIAKLTVMMRPLSAIVAMGEAMNPQVAHLKA